MLFNGMHHLPPIVFCIHQTEPADYHHFIVRIYAWKERGACRRIPFRLFALPEGDIPSRHCTDHSEDFFMMMTLNFQSH